MFKVGENEGLKNQDRCKEALISEACTVPKMYTMSKTHKERKEGEDPATRPVAAANKCINGAPGDVACMILDGLLEAEDEQEDSGEVQSTGEMVYHIKEAKIKIQERGTNTISGSLDAKALYTIIPVKTIAKDCKELMIRSKVKFEGVDYGWAAKYVAMTCTLEEIEEEGLEDIVPGRRKTGGTRPGITSREVFKDEMAEERKEIRRKKLEKKLGSNVMHWKTPEEAESEELSTCNDSTEKRKNKNKN